MKMQSDVIEQDLHGTVEALRAEIEFLKRDHALQTRRMEIEGFKAEYALALKLRQALSQQACDLSERGADQQAEAAGANGKRNEVLPWEERNAVGRLLFRKDGRPRKPVRLVLFTGSGRPRSLFRRVVLKKNGQPRRRYREWMLSADYLVLPEAYRI